MFLCALICLGTHQNATVDMGIKEEHENYYVLIAKYTLDNKF